MWKFLDSGKKRASENMELDALLLREMDPEGAPLLHFYEWQESSATFGYFLDPARFLHMEKIRERGVVLARRPTGGGILFHHCDFAFSLFLPAAHPLFSLNPLENYRFVNERVKKAIQKILSFLPSSPTLLNQEKKPLEGESSHFCMAKPTKYDVMIEGRKIAGSAQRNQKQGLLHQGSIAIALPKREFLEDVLLPHTKVAEEMRLHSFSILGEEWTERELEEIRKELQKELKQEFLENGQ